MMKGFNACVATLVWQGLAAAVIFRQWDNTNAQVCAGKNVGGPLIGSAGSDKHGTFGFPGRVASPAKIAFCSGEASNTLVLVNSGTESSASDRKPSYPTYKNMRSFFSGKPRFPPNCCRLSEFLSGVAEASGLTVNRSPGSNAGCSAK